MTLLTNPNSTGQKTKGLAITYRSGAGNKYGSCPISCKLNISGAGCGNTSKDIDQDYLDVIYNNVPKSGFSFTYSHFPFKLWFKDFPKKIRHKFAVINFSADSIKSALNSFRAGVPTVWTAPTTFWKDNEAKKVVIKDGVKFIRCPQETVNTTGCNNCGGENAPLCARPYRDYIITFTAHGAKNKTIDKGEKGGCYAAGGNVNLHWTRISETPQKEKDHKILKRFIKSLAPRTVLRHHIAGDIGKR